MFQLARAHLYAVGPADARFDPLTLDFTGESGAPIDSLVWLVNTGGKTVLTKLLFSVVRPDQIRLIGADRVGSSAYRGDVHPFVGAHDTAHVMLEWHAVDGRRLVTGVVMEWRDGHAGDRSNLRRSWYSFTPQPGVLDLDSLVGLTSRDGHRLRYSGFFNALRAQAVAIELSLVIVPDSMRRWMGHLEDVGLDPELFIYQLRMNRDEGGVEKLFQFRKEIDFIRFLLELVCDRGQLQIVSDNLAKLAERVAEQPRAQLELEFVQGALAELEPLAAAERQRQTAEQEHLLAQGRARRVHRSFVERLQADEQDLEALRTEAAAYESKKVEHGRVRRRAAANAAELNLLVARLELAAAEQESTGAERERDEARQERDAWRALEPLARARAATATKAALEEEFASAEAESAPLAARRDAAARAYSGRLAADIAAHRKAQKQASSRAKECARHAAEHHRQARALDHDRTERALEERELDRALQRLAEARLALREQGLLGRGEHIADALVRLAGERSAAEDRVAELRGLADASEERRVEIEEQSELERATALAAQEKRSVVLAELEQLEREAAALAGEARLGELADGDEPQLEQTGQELTTALSEAANAADRRLIEQQALLRDDRHALRVLDDEGLLPPSRDLETALARLEAESIAASSGWRYLAHAIPFDQRAALLERRPELAGAIVLSDPHQRSRAEVLLRDAGLNPRSILLVADSQELLDALASGEPRYAIPPDPALYDTAQAGEAKRALDVRLVAADRQIAELEAAREVDRALVRRLRSFLAGDPFTAMRQLRTRSEALETEAAGALGRAEQLRGDLVVLAEQRHTWRDEERALEGRLRVLAAADVRLQALAPDEAHEPGHRARLETVARELEELGREIERLDYAHEQLTGEAGRENERASEERAAAERLEHEQAERALAGSRENAPADVSLEELRASFVEFDRALREATSESELAARLRTASSEEAERLRECARYGEDVLARAAELLLGEAASDIGARVAGLADADSEYDARAAAALAAGARLKETQAAQQEAEKRARQADRRLIELPEQLPDELDATRELYARESALQAEETARETESENLERETRAEITEREAAWRELEGFAALIARELEEDVELGEGEERLAAYAGGTEEARVRFQETLDELDTQARAVGESRDLVTSHAQRIQRFVYEPRFTELATSALRVRLVGDHLAGQAAYLADELGKRERVLRESLEQIAVHKLAAVSELAAIVDRSRQDLRAAERLSRLPDSLGAWSGKQFLRIDADWWQSDEELRARLALVVEELAHGEVALSGIPLLVRTLEGSVGRAGFRTRLLKPAISDRSDYIAVTEAGGISSGGQGATLAILLYCSLCALRAHNSGVLDPRHVRSTLVLDNPIGKASADFLIEKQRAVANALGVQLVYTTGVNDLGALDHFPKLIRLRNDQELRQNIRHVRIDVERLNSLLGGRNGSDGNGYLATAHLFER